MLDTATRRCALPPTCGIAGDSNTINRTRILGSTALLISLRLLAEDPLRSTFIHLMSGSFGDRLRAAQMAKGIATVQTPSSSGGGGGGGGDVENERDRLAREAIEGKRAE